MQRVGDDLLYRVATNLVPAQLARYLPATGKSEPMKLRDPSAIDFSDIEAVREFATSKDGTKVPLTVLRRRGVALDGNNPTMLVGYGAYGMSMSPYFRGNVGHLWFDGGGIYVIANIRGGG